MIRRTFAALLLGGTALGIAHAQSTIDPNSPATGSGLTSLTLRQQFTRAYNDINNLYTSLMPPGTGGVLRTPAQLFGNFVYANSYSTLQLAVNYAISANAALWVPCGTYSVTSLNIPVGAIIVGEALGCVGFSTSSATGDVITLNGFNYIHNIGFSYTGGPSTQRTSGAYIKIAAGVGPVDIGGVYFRDGCEDTHWLGGSVSYLHNSVTTRAGNGCSSHIVDGGIALHINNLTHGAAGVTNTAGIRVLNAEVNCIDCLIQGAIDDVLINPTSGVSYFHSINGIFDEAQQHAVNIIPDTGGAVQRVAMTNSWFASHGGNSVNVAPTGTATVNGVTINQGHFPGFAAGSTSDIFLGTNVSNILVSNVQLAGSTVTGINCDGCQRLNVINANVGTVEGFPTPAFGIAIQGAAKYVNISNSTLIGTTNTGLTISGTADYMTVNGVISDANATNNYFCNSAGTHFVMRGNIGIADKSTTC